MGSTGRPQGERTAQHQVAGQAAGTQEGRAARSGHGWKQAVAHSGCRRRDRAPFAFLCVQVFFILYCAFVKLGMNCPNQTMSWKGTGRLRTQQPHRMFFKPSRPVLWLMPPFVATPARNEPVGAPNPRADSTENHTMVR